MLRLIVFDLDGTLVDSRRDLADSANALLADCGCATLPEEQIGWMVGDGAAALVSRAFAAAGGTPPNDALNRFLAIYNARLVKFTRPYDGIQEALQTLSERWTLSVLTNKPLQAARLILSEIDLIRFFEHVIGGDGPYPRKPDPAGLLALMCSIGVKADETVLVGDSLVDWRTARNAGTTVCLAQYGFGFQGLPVGGLQSGDRLVDHPSALPRVLTSPAPCQN